MNPIFLNIFFFPVWVEPFIYIYIFAPGMTPLTNRSPVEALSTRTPELRALNLAQNGPGGTGRGLERSRHPVRTGGGDDYVAVKTPHLHNPDYI